MFWRIRLDCACRCCGNTVERRDEYANKTRYQFLMETNSNNLIPDGWRRLKVGEIIAYGDYFNTRSKSERKPFWVPYQELIGTEYHGRNFEGITKERHDAPFYENFHVIGVSTLELRQNNNIHNISIPDFKPETAKSKVEKYLNNLKCPPK